MESQTPAWLPALLFPLALLAFVAFWSLIVGLIAAMGWRRFSSRQTSDVDIPVRAEHIGFGSMSIGDGLFTAANYSGCINFYIAPSGLFMRPLILFRMFHPALRFAWNDIRSITQGKQFFARYYALDFGPDLPSILVSDGVMSKAGSRIEEAWRRYSSNAAWASIQTSPGLI